jgi:hypothetical protein
VLERRDRHFLRVHGRDPGAHGPGAGVQRRCAGVGGARCVRHGAHEQRADGGGRADPAPRRGAAPGDGCYGRSAAGGAPAQVRAAAVRALRGCVGRVEPSWASMAPAQQSLLESVARAAGVPDRVSPRTCAHDATVDNSEVVVVTTSYIDVPGYDVLCPAAAVDAVTRASRPPARCRRARRRWTCCVSRRARPRWGAELDGDDDPSGGGAAGARHKRDEGVLHRAGGHRPGAASRPCELAAARACCSVMSRCSAARFGAGAGRGRPAGRARITSAAWSPKHGQAIALAYVRREVEPPAAVQLGAVDGPTVTVVALPFPSPPPSA